MTSFFDVRRHFPIYPHTRTSSDKSADVSTNMTSHQMLSVFLKVLILLYYHTKAQSFYMISVGFRQGAICPPGANKFLQSPGLIGLKYESIKKYLGSTLWKHLMPIGNTVNYDALKYIEGQTKTIRKTNNLFCCLFVNKNRSKK